MTASVASSWGPGFAVGARRQAAFAGRAKGRSRAGVAQPAPARARVREFSPAPVRPVTSPPPMRRRFEADAPVVVPPVSERARQVRRPASGPVRVRPRVRRIQARSATYHGRAVSTKLRLTRRGRLLLLLVAAVAAYAAFGLGRASADASHVVTPASTVAVQPGDSLWTIAVRAFPHSDPRDVVGTLKSINHLSSSDLVVGQKLRLR